MSRHAQSPLPLYCVSQNWPTTGGLPAGGGEGSVNRKKEKSPLCIVTLGHVCEIARVLLAENAIQYVYHTYTQTGVKRRVSSELRGVRPISLVNRKTIVSPMDFTFEKLYEYPELERSRLTFLFVFSSGTFKCRVFLYPICNLLSERASRLGILENFSLSLRATLFRQIEAFTARGTFNHTVFPS